MLAVGSQVGTSSRGKSVRTRQWLGGGIRRQQFHTSQSRQIFFLLLRGAEVHDGERANAGVRGVPARVGGIASHVFGGYHQRGQVHFHAAKFLWYGHARKAQFGGLPQHGKGSARLFLADGRKIGFDFARPELIDHATDRKMLLGEIFRSEHLVGEDIFKEKS